MKEVNYLKQKNIKPLTVNIALLIILLISGRIYGYKTVDDKKSTIDNETLTVENVTLEEADITIKNYLKDYFPLITDNTINKILLSRTVKSIQYYDSTYNKLFYNVSYEIPENYLTDTAKILWELNIPEFKSRIYQLYKGDTIYIDTWNNVVGTIKDKTYTGYYQAYRIKNWPSWKDPEKGKEHLPPVPPGPKNPLGLFVVYYDENSLRYFHGTNKNYLLDNKMRNLSHGCVRNDNENIQKMKEFIIKRIIKSQDLSSWLDSKRTIVYDFELQERFTVKIIYKTYNVDKDENGIYFEIFKDIYNYRKGYIDIKWDEKSLIFLSDKDNIINEYRKKFKNDITDSELIKAVDNLLKIGKEYEKYYLNEL